MHRKAMKLNLKIRSCASLTFCSKQALGSDLQIFKVSIPRLAYEKSSHLVAKFVPNIAKHVSGHRGYRDGLPIER